MTFAPAPAVVPETFIVPGAERVSKALGAPVVAANVSVLYQGDRRVSYVWFGLYQEKDGRVVATYETHDGFGVPLLTPVSLPFSNRPRPVALAGQLTAIPQVTFDRTPIPGLATAVIIIRDGPSPDSTCLAQIEWVDMYNLVRQPV